MVNNTKINQNKNILVNLFNKKLRFTKKNYKNCILKLRQEKRKYFEQGM